MAFARDPTGFTYWSGSEPSVLAPMLAQWRAAFPDFAVIGDGEVIPLLEARHPRLAPLYRRLTIPAARSDIARLAWLEAHGGFYVDAHAGLRDAQALRDVLEALPEGGVALIDKNPNTRPPENSRTHLWPLNGAIFARPGAPFLATALGAITEGLSAHDPDPEPGGIWALSGPGLFITLLRDPAAPTRLLPRWQPTVRILTAADAPIRFYVHKGYRDPARHWSTLEGEQPLLLPPDAG